MGRLVCINRKVLLQRCAADLTASASSGKPHLHTFAEVPTVSASASSGTLHLRTTIAAESTWPNGNRLLHPGKLWHAVVVVGSRPLQWIVHGSTAETWDAHGHTAE